MLFGSCVLALAASLAVVEAQDAEYEYIVVGSGAGGGPLAARLAIAGHKTLLIEAGDDQGNSINYTVPGYNLLATEDPAMAWDFYVRHFDDDEVQRRDPKLTYSCPGRDDYTGRNPPADCEIKGVFYPRSGTLGGCTAHNALVAVYPMESDFDNLAALTGDSSWSAANMRQYLIKLEKVNYLQSLLSLVGHGTDGWLGISHTPINLALQDVQALNSAWGAVYALGNLTGLPLNLASALAGDMNAFTSVRDHLSTLYQVLISSFNGRRQGSREFIVATRDAKDLLGRKRYPLDVKLNTHVTKVTFDTTGNTPKANGVEYLEGKYLYRASKRAGTAGPGKPGSVRATREVIVAGGTYNSPQILKLSGVGPAAELNKFGIPVIKDLPGVGTNLQDHYEIGVTAKAPAEYNLLAKCTFGLSTPDPCLADWQNTPRVGSIYGAAYDASGFAVAAYLKTSVTTNDEFDVMALGSPASFTGYFPEYSIADYSVKDAWSYVILKSHPRSRAGTVTLRSADPLDVPAINYRFFQDGGEADLQAMYEGIQYARDALARQPIQYQETLPGSALQSKEDLFEFTKTHAWSHHASSTCPIGVDNDPMAVLDSKFRVRGVQGLRIVDASIYPKIPGTFTALSTYIIAEKGAADVLADVAASKLKSRRFFRMF